MLFRARTGINGSAGAQQAVSGGLCDGEGRAIAGADPSRAQITLLAAADVAVAIHDSASSSG
jgi:hypothetical protein